MFLFLFSFRNDSKSGPRLNNNLGTVHSKDVTLDLVRMLTLKRAELASALNVMPYMIVSNVCIKQMAELKPLNLAEMRNAKLDGLNDVKISKFGAKFLRVIQETLNFLPSEENPPESIADWLQIHPLPNVSDKITLTVESFYEVFSSGKSLEEAARERSIAVSTAYEYLSKAIHRGLPFTRTDMRRIGIDDKTFNHIQTRLPPDLSQVQLRQIKDVCAPTITWDAIKIVLAYTRIRWHLDNLKCSYVDPDKVKAQPKAVTTVIPSTSHAVPVTANTSCNADILEDDEDDDLLLDAEKSLLGDIDTSPTKTTPKPSAKVCERDVVTPDPVDSSNSDDDLLEIEKNAFGTNDISKSLCKAECDFLATTQTEQSSALKKTPASRSIEQYLDSDSSSMDTLMLSAINKLESNSNTTKDTITTKNNSQPTSTTESSPKKLSNKRSHAKSEIKYASSDSEEDNELIVGAVKKLKSDTKPTSSRVLPDWLAKNTKPAPKPSTSSSTSNSSVFKFKKSKTNNLF